MMREVGTTIQVSASDLVGHLNCRYLTKLDLSVAKGELSKPNSWNPLLDTLWERGNRHERDYIDHLRQHGFGITLVDGVGIDAESIGKTAAAMWEGAEIIVQGAFLSAGRAGRTDILRRIAVPSRLGDWSYEVIDTKLARETKGGTVLQLCLYTDLVATVQGVRAEFAHIVVPWSGFVPQSFRIDDYAAYYRRVMDSLERMVGGSRVVELYPDPKPHCDICRWQDACDGRRRADDHLSLVAGIGKLQINELKQRNISTVASLAGVPLPLPWRPERGTASTYERVREQARIQVAGRAAGQTLCELLRPVPGYGLSGLPAPSRGDIFFDLEGDPFAGEGGLEYLFGYSFTNEDGEPVHIAEWAISREQEKSAFERFIDMAIARRERYPDLHIYHYAAYEPGALKRLMGRYATREEELDFLLRSRAFVDLYGVVRHALRASVESYSIKKLEPLYGFVRATSLRHANMALAKVQARLELGDAGLLSDGDRSVVEGYNRDDCVSTWRLRDWLEDCRNTLVLQGAVIARPPEQQGDPGEALGEQQAKVEALVSRLTVDVPADAAARTVEQHGRWLLAHVLDWHRRENKAVWWEYFRLEALSEEDLIDERAGLAGLAFVGVTGGSVKAPVHRYSFPPQETELTAGDTLHNEGGAKLGSVYAISQEERWVDVKKRMDCAGLHPKAVFAHDVVGSQVLADSLLRLGEHVAQYGLDGEGKYQAARDLLLRLPPRIGDQPLKASGETTLAAALRIAPVLSGGVLPIQGPPGAGKTYTGARMICAMVQAGRKIGVTANSHKVIRNLLDSVIAAAEECGEGVICLQKVADLENDTDCLRFTKDNAALLNAIGSDCQVAAGTAWLWSRADAFETLDVLFVDEAAQMSLANVLAISQAARSLVLLGDPQQLDQPMQGSHPDGTDVSALTHVLAGSQTIAGDRGLFLEETWRLHPAICAFTSGLFYEDRLRARPGLELQEIRSGSRIAGAGLRYLPVIHEGNQNASPEEAERIGRDPRLGFVLDRPARRRAINRAAGHSRNRALQCSGLRASGSPACGSADRHRRQVPGPGGPDRHILDDDLDPRGRAAWYGIPVHCQPA
jgi:uncharacterized protein